MKTVHRPRRSIQIWEWVSRSEAALRPHGARRGNPLMTPISNRDRDLQCYLAAAWTGAVIIPINIHWSIQEIANAQGDNAGR
jgi:long-chain acyl-CoA synthetase